MKSSSRGLALGYAKARYSAIASPAGAPCHLRTHATRHPVRCYLISSENEMKRGWKSVFIILTYLALITMDQQGISWRIQSYTQCCPDDDLSNSNLLFVCWYAQLDMVNILLLNKLSISIRDWLWNKRASFISDLYNLKYHKSWRENAQNRSQLQARQHFKILRKWIATPIDISIHYSSEIQGWPSWYLRGIDEVFRRIQHIPQRARMFI